MIRLGWLDSLSQFIKVDLKINLKAPLIDNSKVIIVKDSFKKDSETAPLQVDKDKVRINLTGLNEKQQQKLTPIIQEYISENKENKFLQVETAALLHDLYDYNKMQPDSKVLAFFKPLISPNDYIALESALYLRGAFKSGKDVSKLKADLRETFGFRGSNIANLCTAGYYENFLMPLYNSNPDKFKELYEQIVQNAVLALFVHSGMEVDDIPIRIKNKVGISRKYGIKFIHIHGIGITNVEKIKECMGSKIDFFKEEFVDKKVFEDEKKNIIILELYL